MPTSESTAASALSAHDPRQLLALLGGDLGADLARCGQLTRDHRQLAGGVDEVAGSHRGHVGGHGFDHRRQLDAQLSEPGRPAAAAHFGRFR